MRMTFEEWKFCRHNGKKRNIVVVNRRLFPGIVKLMSDCNDVAYISIEATETCARLNHDIDNEHYLPDADNVLNLNFDDVEEDIEDSSGNLYCAMSMEQAKQTVDFIEDNINKDFVIHCKAGTSRSQGVRFFMMQMYEDDFEESPINRVNPCLTPNMGVVAMLKRAYYEKHDVFGAV